MSRSPFGRILDVAFLFGSLLASGCQDARQSTPAPDPAPAVWPRYHFDLHNTAFNPAETKLTPGNVATLTPAWQLQVGAPVYGSPAVAQGLVFFGDTNGILHVVDDATGAPVYQLNLGKNNDGGGQYATPSIDGDATWVQDAFGNLIRLETTTGREVFRVTAAPNNAGFASVPVWDGKVFNALSNSSSDMPCTVGRIEAFDGVAGALLWRWDAVPPGYLGAGIWNAPSIDERRGMIFFATGNRPNGNSLCGPAFPRGLAGEYTDSIVALDARSGALGWAYHANPNDEDDKDFTGSSTVLFNDGVRDLVSAGDKRGLYYALERDTGNVAWVRDLNSQCAAKACGPIFSPAGFAYGKLFLNVGFPQRIPGTIPDIPVSATVALDAATGNIVWRVPGEHAQLGGPGIASGIVFIGSSHSLVALRQEDGTKLFEFPIGGDVWTSPAVLNGCVYFGGTDGSFTKLRLAS